MVFSLNPPVKDAADGEADKSLRLPYEMRSLFLWGYAQKIILGISIVFRGLKFDPDKEIGQKGGFCKGFLSGRIGCIIHSDETCMAFKGDFRQIFIMKVSHVICVVAGDKGSGIAFNQIAHHKHGMV